MKSIELAMSKVKGYVKSNNTTFKLNDEKELLVEAVGKITAENWENDENHKRQE